MELSLLYSALRLQKNGTQVQLSADRLLVQAAYAMCGVPSLTVLLVLLDRCKRSVDFALGFM